MYEELLRLLRNNHHPNGLKAQAADAIEQLDAKSRELAVENVNLTGQLAEVYARQQWVPVTERLPAEDVAVLVTYIGYGSYKPRADLLAYRYDGTWLWVEDATSCGPIGGVECTAPITHWMPLPEPPKEET